MVWRCVLNLYSFAQERRCSRSLLTYKVGIIVVPAIYEDFPVFSIFSVYCNSLLCYRGHSFGVVYRAIHKFSCLANIDTSFVDPLKYVVDARNKPITGVIAAAERLSTMLAYSLGYTARVVF